MAHANTRHDRVYCRMLAGIPVFAAQYGLRQGRSCIATPGSLFMHYQLWKT
jgi:hypothetical protein